MDRGLCFGGKPFRAGRLLEWQKHRWRAEIAPAKQRGGDVPGVFVPGEAVVHILAGLEAGLWGDVDALAAPLEVFCGFKVDSGSVCRGGWRWGCLARQEFDGKTWYRLAPPPSTADTRPDHYLAVLGDDSVAVDLDTASFQAIEELVMISRPRAAPGGRPALLVTPNLVKLGRAADAILASACCKLAPKELARISPSHPDVAAPPRQDDPARELVCRPGRRPGLESRS